MKKTLNLLTLTLTAAVATAVADDATQENYSANIAIPTSTATLYTTTVNLGTSNPSATAVASFVSSADDGWYCGTSGAQKGLNGGTTIVSGFSANAGTDTVNDIDFTLTTRASGYGAVFGALVLHADTLKTAVGDAVTGSVGSYGTLTAAFKVGNLPSELGGATFSAWVYDGTTATLVTDSKMQLAASTTYNSIPSIDISELKETDVICLIWGANAPTTGWKSMQIQEFTLTATGTLAETEPVIPEPATATLSLLALAGLAARRRRK